MSFGVRASIHTLPKNRPISQIVQQILGIFWGGTPLKLAGRHPRRLRDDLVMIFDGIRPPLGEPWGSLWGVILGARVSTWGVYVDLSVLFVGASKKERKSYQKSSKKEPFGRRSTWLKCSK